MRTTIVPNVAFIIFIAYSAAFANMSSDSFDMVIDVVDTSGHDASSDNYVLSDSLGQSTPIGESSSDNYNNQAGFWYAADIINISGNRIPDTSQTTSYTTTLGEDNDYTINPPSYTDNGNGTINDNITGLLWQKQEDNTARTWNQAVAYCSGLALSGSGWRLPTHIELMSIVNYGTVAPTIDTTAFLGTHYGFGTFNGFHWTSVVNAQDTTRAWIVDFTYGNVYSDQAKTAAFYTRCVRGQQAEPAYVDNSDGTITDLTTNLIWQKQDDGTAKTWEAGLNYCENLALGGYSDWRVPNVKELRTIGDDTLVSAPFINSTYFPGTTSGYYWTSTSGASPFAPPNPVASNTAAIVNFGGGNVDYPVKTDTYNVRCIRGGLPILTIYTSGSGTVTSTPANIDCGAYCIAGFNQGTSVTLTSTPASGFAFAGWSGGGCSGLGTCTVTMDSAKSVNATFEMLPAVNGSCGSSNGLTLVTAPTTSLCTTGLASSVSGAGPWSWTCNGQYGGSNANCAASIQTYAVTFKTDGNGSISGNSSQTVSHGSSANAVSAVSNTNYHFVSWIGNNGFVTTTSNPLTVNNVTSALTITANFAHDAVNGSCGTSNGQTFTTIPTSNLCSAGTTTGATGTGPWTWTCSGQYGGTDANCSANIQKWTITPSAGANGSISPNTAVLVTHGTTTAFQITPNSGYHIALVSGCSGSLVGNTYTTGPVIADCSVTASFNNSAPTTPTVNSPLSSSETTTTTPLLTVNASTDPNGDPVTYTFEVYSNSNLLTLVTSITGAGTSWTVSAGALADNTWYWWRVLATDGTASSLWMSTTTFFVNTANDAPTAPAISSPVNNGQVASLMPVLSVTNASDVDNDTLTYNFDVATDGGFSNIVASSTGVTQSAGSTSWTVSPALSDNTPYYWRAKVQDSHGAAGPEVSAGFFVNLANDAPTTPTISSPANGSEMTSQTPVLTVTNATDVDGDTLSYMFEIDKVNTFDSADKQTSSLIAGGAGTTDWTPAALADNTTWYWRAKANDGLADSPWMVTASVFVNTANDAPSTPTLGNPADNAAVTLLQPTLSVNAATDIDNDSLTYEFRVYSDSGLTSLVSSTTGATTSWVVATTLSDNTRYYWQARSVDQHGASSGWMAAASFFVNNNGYNDPPSLTITAPGAAEPMQYGPNYTIQWSDSDPDSDATITLGYDTTGAGCNGTQITMGISENDPVNNYVWNISSLTEGTYYVYGSISDGTTTVCAYGAGPITKLDKNLGDLNGDGTVDMLDALRALRIAADIITATPQDIMRGDVSPIVSGQPTRNGHIDISDALAILRRSAGLVTW